MRLLIDAGNTRIKWAVARNSVNDIVASGVVDDNWSELADFVGVIESACLSCVASESVSDRLSDQVQARFGVTLKVVSVSASAAGMINNYADLARLGVDRWVAALGARYLFPEGALIVIDAGTAITIDVISLSNHFEGGVILPGFGAMHDALLGRTAGIDSKRREVSSVIGRNTRDCVNAGVQYGLIGAVERVVDEMRLVLGQDSPRILLMGGDAHVIVADSKLKVELQSSLIFYGLMLH